VTALVQEGANEGVLLLVFTAAVFTVPVWTDLVGELHRLDDLGVDGQKLGPVVLVVENRPYLALDLFKPFVS
jgi:hypothetical protein